MIFRLVVKYLKVFKYIPFFALWLDAMMMIWNMLFKPDLGHALEWIEEEVSAWPGVNVTLHKFGGLQFNYGKYELGHIHSNGILDILFPRKTKHELIDKGLTNEHHVFKKSGWTSLYIKSSNDVEKALSLIKVSYKRRQTASATSHSAPEAR